MAGGLNMNSDEIAEAAKESNRTNSDASVVNPTTEQFWDNIYKKNPIRAPDPDDPVLLAALNHFGNVSGAKLLDLGCGEGRTSLFFAQRGANVTAIDISEVAISGLTKFCHDNNVRNITAIKRAASEISNLGPFDFVFGSMILHHLEPFDEFAKCLRQIINPGGKAFFYENNGFSDTLVWFRKNVVGKYGIPKYGDDEEFPLTPGEIDCLRKHFSVQVVYPELLFFRLVSVYLLKGRMTNAFGALDKFFFRYPAFRAKSYRQYLLLS